MNCFPGKEWQILAKNFWCSKVHIHVLLYELHVWKHVCSSTEVITPSCVTWSVARTFTSIKMFGMNLFIASLLLNIHRLECGSSYYLYKYRKECTWGSKKIDSMQNFTFMAVVCQCNFGSVQSPRYLEWREKVRDLTIPVLNFVPKCWVLYSLVDICLFNIIVQSLWTVTSYSEVGSVVSLCYWVFHINCYSQVDIS